MHEHPATGPWRRYKRQVCAGLLLVNVMLLGAVGTPNHVLARTGGVAADRPIPSTG